MQGCQHVENPARQYSATANSCHVIDSSGRLVVCAASRGCLHRKAGWWRPRFVSCRRLRSEPAVADMRIMRVIVRSAVIGVVALLVLGARENAVPAFASTHAHTMAEHHIAGGSSSGDQCVLRAHGRSLPVSGTTTGGGPPPAQSGSVGSGNLVVEIPPAVFIQAEGRRLDVTTNTGEPPRAHDIYYYIADGRAVVAGAGMRHHVLSKCTKSRWRPSASA
jgi:hypothetical protein